ncbi:MAG TPA: alpha/beta fold hydrolase [bacterium]|jgi:pimeloyl-ACP methyl ester carboxylesterase
MNKLSEENRIKKRWIIYIAAIAVAGFIWNAGYSLCRRAFYIPQSARKITSTPGRALSVNAYEVNCPSSEGYLVPAWYNPGENGAAVILLHGLGGTREQLAELARFLMDNGYAVILPDQRGHGENPIPYTTYGRAESVDALACIDWLREQDGIDDSRIGIFGASMGAAAAIHAAARDENLGCLIADSSYSRISEQAKNDLTYEKAPVKVPEIFHPLVLGVFRIYQPFFIGEYSNFPDPIESIVQVRCPVLLTHGSDDTRISPDNTDYLYIAARDAGVDVAKSIVDGGGHCNYHRQDEFRRQLLIVLNDSLLR